MTPDEVGRVTVSEFFGIVIAMFASERAPPHFHARYERHEALVAIDTLEFVEGWLPKRAYALVLEWPLSTAESFARTGTARARRCRSSASSRSNDARASTREERL